MTISAELAAHLAAKGWVRREGYILFEHVDHTGIAIVEEDEGITPADFDEANAAMLDTLALIEEGRKAREARDTAVKMAVMACLPDLKQAILDEVNRNLRNGGSFAVHNGKLKESND